MGLLLAELTLRVLGIAPARYARTRHLETEDKRLGLDLYPDDPRDYFPLDLSERETRERLREVGFDDVAARAEQTPHGVAFSYTEELCRGERIPELPPGSARVMTIGDSFTEGQGVREEDTFSALLDRRLDGAQVINCGRRGYDFPDLHSWFERHIDLEPDVVLYAMLLNDPERSESFREEQRYIDDWIVNRRQMVGEGDGAPPPWPPRLFSLIDDRLEMARVGAATTRWYRGMVRAPNRDGWAATVEHIASMRDAMRARGGELVVVLWPLLVELESYPFAETHEIIAEALRARGVPFHDALEAFRGEDAASLWVHPADRHPNERAHAVFAGLVEPIVESLLPRPRS